MNSSVIVWWGERLVSRFPVSDRFKLTPYNYKEREGAVVELWPKAIARQALYDDYKAWVEDNNLKSWPDTLPDDSRWVKPASDLVFFSTLSPYVYTGDKKKMVKNYWVWKSVPFEGAFTKIKVRRYFIRLGTWEEHVAAYRRGAGQPSFTGRSAVPLERYAET